MIVINKNLLLSINKKMGKVIKSLLVTTQQYYKEISFNIIIQIAKYNIILKILWLNNII